MNKQRDRLVELLKETRCERSCDGFKNIEVCNGCTAYERHAESADYILADGWMRPPCKVGEFIYLIDRGVILEGRVETITCYKDSFSIKGIWWNEKELHPFISPSIVWGKEAFASKEEAEAKLKEGLKGGAE